MKVEDVPIKSIIVNIKREYSISNVEIEFKQNNITLKAMMRCNRTIDDEIKTHMKILTYLGFDSEIIKDINNE